MGNELAKALKRKTDAQFRVNGEDYTPSIVERADGVVVYNAPAETMIPYVAGKNVNIGTSGGSKVISAIMNILAGANISVSAPDENGAVTVSASIGGKPIDLTGLMDGYVLKYDSVSDSFIVGEGGGGGLAEIPQATETTLGGIKAKAKTTETAEVAIDPATGKLYSNAPDEAVNGLPAGGTVGQILSKVDGMDYNAEWIDKPSTATGLYAWSFPDNYGWFGESAAGVLSGSTYPKMSTTLLIGQTLRVSKISWAVGVANTWSLSIDGITVGSSKTSTGAQALIFDIDIILPSGTHIIAVTPLTAARMQYVASLEYTLNWLKISGWVEVSGDFHPPIKIECVVGSLEQI